MSTEAFAIRGLQHEEAYLESLRDKGVHVCELGKGTSTQDTLEAMKQGYDIIAQATLTDQNWVGIADILKKVECHSSVLGGWSYQVVDTKLSQETKAGAILQLCLYSDLLTKIQNVEPEIMSIVSPGFVTTDYHYREYSAYFRMLKTALYKTVQAKPIDIEHPKDIYPDPVVQCDFCDWNTTCKKKRYRDDDLSVVAGLTKIQKKELHSLTIQTMTSLANWEMPDDWRPAKGVKESYQTTQEQASIQHQSRQKGQVLYELLPINTEQKYYGLTELPMPSRGDLFFDIEGDAFVGPQGIEYLLGFSYLDEEDDENRELTYKSFWSDNHADEKVAFENSIKFIFERLKQYPDLHIYHYNHYETTALKRLMGKHATCEGEVRCFVKNERLCRPHESCKAFNACWC